MLVWDDELEVDDCIFPEARGELRSPTISNLERGRVNPRSKRRSLSIGPTDFPPPMKRISTDTSGLPRPISFASKFPRINPGASGVAVLEHMERLDAVEASLHRLGDELVIEETDEDVHGDLGASSSLQNLVETHNPASHEGLAVKQGDEESELAEVDESDITFQRHDKMAASMPHIGPRSYTGGVLMNDELREEGDISTQQHSNWTQSDIKKTVIVEVS